MNKVSEVNYKKDLEDNGYTVIETVFSSHEIDIITETIQSKSSSSNITFRKSKDLFAIRQFLKEIPELKNLLFNAKLKEVLRALLGNDSFVVKSIYFDKPEQSNWFVSYHQDLTISVNKKLDIEEYTNWTIKHNQFSVQPPKEILENISTIRIHLDDTNEKNGALKVIPKSHKNGVVRADSIDFQNMNERVCSVKKGGIMIMKPLLFHASNKTINNERRRVIHIEFSNITLPEQLSWSEKNSIN